MNNTGNIHQEQTGSYSYLKDDTPSSPFFDLGSQVFNFSLNRS